MAHPVMFSISITKKSSFNLSRDTDCPEKYFIIDHDHFQRPFNFFPFTNYPTIQHYIVFKAVRKSLDKS